MGCPCRQIRAAISHLPGGKFLVGLLPALPPKGPSMKMLARVAGQSFQLAHGPHYRADDDRVIYVEPADVDEMRRLGCEPAPEETAEEPAAQEIMRQRSDGIEVDPPPVKLTVEPGKPFAFSIEPDGSVHEAQLAERPAQ